MSDEPTKIERFRSEEEGLILSSTSPRSVDYPNGYGYGTEIDDDADSKIDLRRWWSAVLKRKRLIVTIALVATGLVTLQMYRIRDTYEASTLLDVGKDNTAMVKSGDVIVQNDDTLRTKILILQSTPVLEDVVLSLGLDRNPNFLETGPKSVWQGLATLRDRVLTPSRIKPEAQSELRSASVRPEGQSIRSAEESQRLEPFVAAIRKTLLVEDPTDQLLKVSFTHTDPAIAAAVPNAIAQMFIVRSFASRTEKYTKASDWLERTTAGLKDKVQMAEQALATYTREHNIFGTDNKQSLISDRLTKLHGELTKAETDRILKESLYEEVKLGHISQVPEAFSDPKIVELQKKLAELMIGSAQLSVAYGPENPRTIEVQQEIAAIQTQIAANQRALEEKFKADCDRATRNEQAFQAALDQAKREAVQENQDAIQYSVLLQEVDTAKSLYKDFLQKTNQANFEVAQQHNSVQVVEPAHVPRITVGPIRQQWILLAFALSLAGGVGVALMLEYTDKTIKNSDDVVRYVQLPAIGVIPAMPARKARLLTANSNEDAKRNQRDELSPDPLLAATPGIRDIFHSGNSTPAAEAYRLLRTSVVLCDVNNSRKKILITSSEPGEGKTTTVANVAISLAELGASVLIIDCDLRTPSIHRVFGVEHSRGLSTYVSAEVGIDDLIQKLPTPKLELLPAGAPPKNPAELIGSKKMRQALAILSDRYDYILIDSPPLVGVADPLILSTLVDGVLLVVEAGKSNRDSVLHARQMLSSMQARVYGVVVNKVDPKSLRYGAYYSRAN